MAMLTSTFFAPATLSGYVREAALNYPINQFKLAQWLPNRNVNDLSFRFLRGGDGLLDAASFRSYDAESSIGKRPGVTRVSGELPPISRKLVLREYDNLRMRSNPDPAIRDAILSDADKAARQVNARIELARGSALVNGTVTFPELGSMVADFGRDPSMAVNAGTLWSNAGSADPVSDLQTWVTAYVNLNGVPPGAMVASTRIRNYMLRATSIRQLASTTGVTSTLVSPTKLGEVLDSFALPQLTVFDAQVRLNGSATRIVPDNVVLLLPPPVDPNDFEGTMLGATFWGTTAEQLDPSYGIEPDAEGGIVAGNYREEDPIQLWTKASAIALPVLANPNLSLAAVVL